MGTQSFRKAMRRLLLSISDIILILKLSLTWWEDTIWTVFYSVPDSGRNRNASSQQPCHSPSCSISLSRLFLHWHFTSISNHFDLSLVIQKLSPTGPYTYSFATKTFVEERRAIPCISYLAVLPSLWRGPHRNVRIQNRFIPAPRTTNSLPGTLPSSLPRGPCGRPPSGCPRLHMAPPPEKGRSRT